MSYNSQLRSAILQFSRVTASNERTAIGYLKSSNWNVEAAANLYFSSNNGSRSRASSDKTELESLFEQFRDSSDQPNTMTTEGAIRFMEEIGVELDEATVLVIAELLQAPVIGVFEKDKFVEGWSSINAMNLETIRSKIPILRSNLDNDTDFKKVYKYTFNLALPPGQRSLPLEIAIYYWCLLLKDRFKDHIDDWISFLENKDRNSITRDTWNCMYEFVQLAKNDPGLASYDVDGAWPSILDDFVRHQRSKA
ncbi:Similar to DCN1-like protein; acc. no. Q9VUQ8 [Pyronema omphalodes CBS 100304]|uniref:Defective in cullin neddylation protein n=1 Tax=Pyronema omphalodes (strain CBS 100304) TaxID=1076935 RepID=U4LSS9_PYROM|nr:Similar to DCN1-like protein; acc. no. Q9VUQ8 [Pyronema omphalodes CBS 100304]